MDRLNCYEAEAKGNMFKFSPGIKVDKILEGRIFVNGLGTMLLFDEPKPVESNIEEVFADEKGVWVGKKDGCVYIYQAGITSGNNYIVPASRDPRYSRTKYVKLICSEENLVKILGDGRILARLFEGTQQIVLLELEKEAVVHLEGRNGETALFESVDDGFKI
ncbi:MAG: hypothetical protein QHH75_10110 [Bacillota bacterium]|nr:hypothetical protein [Bacillota bacterium]